MNLTLPLMKLAICLPTTPTWNGILECHGTDQPEFVTLQAAVNLDGEQAMENGRHYIRTTCLR